MVVVVYASQINIILIDLKLIVLPQETYPYIQSLSPASSTVHTDYSNTYKYYYSIGGGVHMGETAEDAVKREVFEETGVAYDVDRLAVIHENFFDENKGTLAGLDCHEVCLYYLMKPRGTQELHSNSTTFGVKENMYWIPINELDNYKAFPSFMKDYLCREHVGIEHIVTDERTR